MEKLKEQLIQADLNRLNVEMDNDEDLKILLNTKGKDFPQDSDYLCLIQELTEEYQERTLLDVINLALEWNFYGTKTHSLFSKAGDNLVGFVAYISNEKEVLQIKMFSFDLSRPNPVFIRDLENLINKLFNDGFEKISWSAMPQNKANKIYESAINKFNGTCWTKDNLVYYEIKNEGNFDNLYKR